MRPSSPHFFPLAWPFLLGLVVLFGLVVLLLEIRVLSYAYERIGIKRHWVFLLLVLSLAGSAINIPIATLSSEQIVSDRVVTFFGMRYVVPVVQSWPGTILAV